MKTNFLKAFASKLKAKDSLVKSALLIAFSLLFGFSSAFGINNSSMAATEKQLFQIKNEYGQYIHIRYHLSQCTDAKRQSLVSPINNFNSYRIQEVGRNASFVSNLDYSIEYNNKKINCNYLVYSDYYSEYYSLNRFGLFQGSYKPDDFNSDNVIYVSLSVANYFGGAQLRELLEKEVTILFGQEKKEFVIKGIIDESNHYDSPIYFSKLFGDNFILFNSSHLKQYNFTDVFFESDGDTFVSDSLALINAYKQSYVNYYSVLQSIGSFKDGAVAIRNEVAISNPVSIAGVFASILFITISIILLFCCLVVLATHRYNGDVFYKNIIIFAICVLCSCLPLIILLCASYFGIYISKASISASIVFLAMSLLLSVAAFVRTFKNRKGELHD